MPATRYTQVRREAANGIIAGVTDRGHPQSDERRARQDSWRAGLRAGTPFALAGFLLSLSFAIVARRAGLPTVATIAMSAIVYAGSAQFAAISILAGGGNIGAAVGAAALVNSRFLPMGIALASSLPGNAFRRAAQAQTIVDSSWAMAARGDGTYDRFFLFGSTAVQYVTWIAGTAVGAFAGDLIGDPNRFGLDAIFPTFFLALLIAELRVPRARVVAFVGAGIALALVPLAPVGVPVLAASTAAVLGLHAPPQRRG